jgi:putative hemolysin
VRRTRLQQLLDENRPGAKSLAALRAAPERFLATVQIGITVVSTTAAAFGGAALARHLEPLVERVPWMAEDAQQIALAIVVAIVSYFSLVLGELVPKSLALRAAETYALLMARPMLWLSQIARPLVWFLTVSSNVVLRPFSDRTNFMEARISKEELQQMVNEAAETGAVHEQVSELASRALQFDKLTLRDLMIPRNRIDALPLQATAQQVQRFLLEMRRSRIPVYDGNLDNIIGYVSAKDIVAMAWQGKLIVLQDLIRPVKIVPETMVAVEVLRFMRREHERLAVAVDEHGVVAGMATFEDLIEELVGDVFSENDQQVTPINKLPDGSALVRGDVPLRDVNRELGLELEEAEGATTMAGLCERLAGGIPHRNARLAANGGVILVVLEASPRTVRRVQVIPPPLPAPAVDGDDRDG